jgi:hypothetical protein
VASWPHGEPSCQILQHAPEDAHVSLERRRENHDHALDDIGDAGKNVKVTMRCNEKDALHARELPSETRGEVVRAFFSNMEIPPLSRPTCLIYPMKNEEASLITASLSEFNEWGAFMEDRVVPRPRLSALAAESEQDSSVREPNPGPFEDLDDNNEDSDGGPRSGCHHHSTVVLLDSFWENEEFMVPPNQPSTDDAMEALLKDLAEEECLECLAGEQNVKHNAEMSSIHTPLVAPMARGRWMSPLHWHPSCWRSSIRGVGSKAMPREYLPS